MNYGIDYERCKVIAEELKYNEDWDFLVNQDLLCSSVNTGTGLIVDVHNVKELFSKATYNTLSKLLERWFAKVPETSSNIQLFNLAISNLACIIAIDRTADKLDKSAGFKTRSGNIMHFVTSMISVEDASGYSGLVASFYFDSDVKYYNSNFRLTLQPLFAYKDSKYLNRDVELSYVENGRMAGVDVIRVSELSQKVFEDKFSTTWGKK